MPTLHPCKRCRNLQHVTSSQIINMVKSTHERSLQETYQCQIQNKLSVQQAVFAASVADKEEGDNTLLVNSQQANA